MATISRINTTPIAAAARIRADVGSRPRCPSRGTSRSDAAESRQVAKRVLGWGACCSCSGLAGVSWIAAGFGYGVFTADPRLRASSSCAVRTSAKVQSSTSKSRLVSNSKRAGTELQRLPAHQLDEDVRQLIGMRHPRAIHQDRDHADVARQGSLDLKPNEIIGVVKTTPPMLISDGQPPVTDERQQDITGADRSGDYLYKVIAQLDRVDILEDLPAAEAICQAVV